ncbi:hypothetical protein [Methylobacterium sp. J-077]|uniref:hypothetical protein n=1 Tax=Methylobacterium sp. J-077 TaxID=2836656 RepID=UPI001FBA7098|nr:hypothetical protein [Methylobacterium sp. J-077]MCJ2121020.1 hypothetical protein [Methylobacterium sp. J-077]
MPISLPIQSRHVAAVQRLSWPDLARLTVLLLRVRWLSRRLVAAHPRMGDREANSQHGHQSSKMTDDEHYELVRHYTETATKVLGQFSRENDRTAAIVIGSFLDDFLLLALKSRLVDSPELDNYFKPDGACGSMGAKCRLGLLLGLYTRPFYKDLRRMGDIRNIFAHNIDIDSFNHDRVKNICGNLTIVKSNVWLDGQDPPWQPINHYFNWGRTAEKYQRETREPKWIYFNSWNILSQWLLNAAANPSRPVFQEDPDTISPRASS